MALKPWYHVVYPREDLREGKPLDAAEFAVHPKFAASQELDMTLKVTFTIETTGDGQLSEQKIEETKIALRELGLDDNMTVG